MPIEAGVDKLAGKKSVLKGAVLFLAPSSTKAPLQRCDLPLPQVQLI